MKCGLLQQVVGRQWYWVYEVESPTDDGNSAEPGGVLDCGLSVNEHAKRMSLRGDDDDE